MINRWESPDWKDTTHTAHYVAELRKALEAELAQSVEPYAVFQGLVDSGEHGAFNLDLLKMIPRGAYLYLHPPQPQATTLPQQAKPYDQQELELCDKCGWKAIMPGESCLVCERDSRSIAAFDELDSVDVAHADKHKPTDWSAA